MFKKSSMYILTLVVLLFLLQGCGAKSIQENIEVDNDSTTSANNDDTKDVGILIAGSDVCYNAAADTFIKFAEKEGWNVVKYDSEYKPDLEKATVQSLIAKKVDAIAVVTNDINNAGECAALCKEANMPLFFYMTTPNFPDGVTATAISTTDWYMTGYLNGEYIAKNYPESKCVLIEGGYDQGMTELSRQGIIDGINSIENNKVAIVSNVSGGWMKPNAYAIMESLIEADATSFDTIIAYNEEMMLGVIDYLKENDLLGKYKLLAVNGREDVSKVYIKEGIMEATVGAPTSAEGDVAFQLMKAYFEGEELPYHINLPVRLLNKDNIDTLVPWNPDEYVKQKEAGVFDINYKDLEIVKGERNWSTEGNNYDSVLFHK